MNKSLILHFRPNKIRQKALDFSMTFGLGGMALVLLMMLFTTGILLKFYYLPFPDRAYDSIMHLKTEVLFGSFIRNIHYWSANLLIAASFLHFLRVFFTSAFHRKRRFNWIIGLSLFIITILFNFTGYLLPWDQLSYWAVTICTGMMEYIPVIGKWIQNITAGGAEVNSSTLSIFYAAHTMLFPALIILILPFHFWRIRKAGGIALPDDCSDKADKMDVIPNLILRETVTALVLIAAVLLLSVFFNAPLGDEANPGLSPNPTKAPWYFMGLQEMLLHVHPFFAVCVIPLIILAGLILTAYSRYSDTREGIWFISPKGKATAAASFTGALVLTAFAVILDEYLIDFTALLLSLPQFISNGIIPLAAAFLAFFIFYFLFIKRFSPDKNEKVQAVFVFFLTVFIVFTVTGIWFRGTGMKLVF